MSSCDVQEQDFYLSCLQSLLFVAGRPITIDDAARSLEVPASEAGSLLSHLAEHFNPGGLQIVQVAGGFQMTTRPEFTDAVARFLEPPAQRLSHASLETLALVAYRQPITQPEIEMIRGVKSDSCVHTLMERGLIEDAGRKDVVGRPILYRTTLGFLLYLGINELTELPPLEIDLPDAQPGDGAVSPSAAHEALDSAVAALSPCGESHTELHNIGADVMSPNLAHGTAKSPASEPESQRPVEAEDESRERRL
jgi:segregation and condensation protein B